MSTTSVPKTVTPAAEAAALPSWDPYTDWRHQDVDWIRANVSKDDLKRFTRRSDLKGMLYASGFLLIVTATGTLAYTAFLNSWWILLAVGLYLHGSVCRCFNPALHELSHHTVFRSRWLNEFWALLFGFITWTRNPYLYEASHLHYHHRYTLFQNSDGEDSPGYIKLTPMVVLLAFVNVLRIKPFLRCLGRLVTLRPTSMGWRGRGYHLDNWEKFVIERAPSKTRKAIYRTAYFMLAAHILFAAFCLLTGLWFLLILIPLSPLYGGDFILFSAGVHQHAACEANDPDFRRSCGSVKLNPLTSFLYWKMEYHTEHHMFASIPCYHLEKFSRHIADQMPPREWSLPRIWRIHKLCQEKYGSRQYWRDHFGRFKGL